jgi:hypothetical protein
MGIVQYPIDDDRSANGDDEPPLGQIIRVQMHFSTKRFLRVANL